MVEKIKRTINHLESREEKANKKKYTNDANDLAFKRHILEQVSHQNNLLYQIASDIKHMRLALPKLAMKTKREPSKYNLHIASEIAKGKSFKDAIKSWEEK